MKKLAILLSLLALGATLSAQEADTSYWKKSGVATLNFTNTGFSPYWQAGGIPSVSLGGLVNLAGNYEKANITWSNTLDLGYGVIRQGGADAGWRKNDDRIELTSKFGSKINDKLSASSLLNFRTQFAPGVTFNSAGEVQDTISRFLAPAFINLGVGIDYKPSADFSLYYAPINGKVTIVSDTAFSLLYMPADFQGKNARFELGSFLNVKFKKTLMTNVILQSKADFFMNYLTNFGNVDVNWENLIAFQVNKYITTSFFTHLIYDDDIRFAIVDDAGQPTGRTGPRTQFKHVLSIGLTYKFLK